MFTISNGPSVTILELMFIRGPDYMSSFKGKG